MNDELIARLRSGADGLRARQPDCPDEHAIAAYVDSTLPANEALRLETHLADCDACIALVGLLSRQREEPARDVTPELALTPAAVRLQRRRSWTRFAPHLAAAAAVLVTISALTNLLQFQGSAGGPEVRATRSGSQETPALHVLYPTAGIILNAAQLRFRWAPVEGSRYYEVHIVSDSGELVREERVFGTEWHPTDTLGLQPGSEYFVQIDAYPADAKTISSEHVPFRVAPRP